MREERCSPLNTKYCVVILFIMFASLCSILLKGTATLTSLDHDLHDALHNVNTLHRETCFIRDQSKHVSAQCERGISPINCPNSL